MNKKVLWTTILSVIGGIAIFIILNAIEKKQELQRSIEEDLAHNFETYTVTLDPKDLPKNISIDFANNVNTTLSYLNHHIGILPTKVLEADKNDTRTVLEIKYYTENFLKYLKTIELKAGSKKEIELKTLILKLKESSTIMSENILANLKSEDLDKTVNKDFLRVQEDAMNVSTCIFNNGLTKYYIRVTNDYMNEPFTLNDSEPISFLGVDSDGKFNPYMSKYTVLKKDTLKGIKEKTYTPSTPSKTVTTNSTKYEPSIGMTDYETVDSTWGRPNNINKTETIYGVKEQWVYDRGYLYFEDHYLTSIQTSR